MAETRRVHVQQDNPAWQEYDREVLVELCHNRHQSSVLRLSRVEAQSLQVQLQALLEQGADRG